MSAVQGGQVFNLSTGVKETVLGQSPRLRVHELADQPLMGWGCVVGPFPL